MVQDKELMKGITSVINIDFLENHEHILAQSLWASI